MRLEKKYYSFLLLFFLWCQLSLAQIPAIDQVTDTIVEKISLPIIEIGDIEIIGNKKTKGFIILREIPFKKGDTYPLDVLIEKFEDGKKQLMNTSLFHSAVIASKNFEGNKVNVTVTVKERWYIFPLPYFKLVDRNLNQWIVEQKASLNRVNYGVKLFYYNVTGKNDKLKFGYINGYTRQFSFSYDRLYIDKKLKWGAKLSVDAGNNKEINYKTIQDKQSFYKDENAFVRNFFTGEIELSYRRAIKTRHRFGIGFTKETVSDTIIKLNPVFFNENKRTIAFPELSYAMTYYDVDYIPYPTKGYAAQVAVIKKGFNKTNNLWKFSAQANGTWRLSPKYFFDLNVFGSLKAPFKQPYFNQRLLGYGELYLQGYEYYVIDGVAAGFLKATMTRELFKFDIKLPPKVGKTTQRIPIKIFGKVYGNTGYVHNPQPGENYLSNKMLYSGGFGIDILTFYDVTFKLEYSFNAVGQNGLFLHRKSIF